MRNSPSGFAPLQSLTQASCTIVLALTRFLPPQRNPAVEIHHSRAIALLRVTLRPRAYHAPRRFSPSAASLVFLSTRRAHGVLPSELDLAEVASASRRRLPLLGLAMPDRYA